MANKMNEFWSFRQLTMINQTSLSRAISALRVKRDGRICGVGKPLISHQDNQRTCRLASAAVSSDGESRVSGWA